MILKTDQSYQGKNDIYIDSFSDTRVIWAFGVTDTLSYHGSNRGAAIINFFGNPPVYVNNVRTPFSSLPPKFFSFLLYRVTQM